VAAAVTHKYGAAWTRDELVLCLYLYCQIPFAETKATNPEVVRLAHLLRRTPGSVARKLGNFGAFDPVLAKRGITGLTHYSKADKGVWDEFYQAWDSLVEHSGRLLEKVQAKVGGLAQGEDLTEEEERIISPPTGRTDRPRTVLTRLYQSFFRRAVLSSYQSVCCVCAFDLPTLLVASHIIPWSVNEKTRTDPQNGLCLCALHDRAFDRGVLTVDTSFTIRVSRSANNSRAAITKHMLLSFKDRPMRLPRRFVPTPEYLAWHGRNIFRA